MPRPPKPILVEDKKVFSTPWVNLFERRVDFGGDIQPFYAISQNDYVAVVARTPSQRVLTVRQYRAAVDAFTLELPAGTVDAGETPEQACRRELEEETGHSILQFRSFGSYYPDTGRNMNLQHIFLAQVEETASSAPTEAGLQLEYYTLLELQEQIRNGGFRHQLHISALLLAVFLDSDWTRK